MVRAFIAVDIPEEIKDRIKDITKKWDRGKLKIVRPENLHITLKFLGEISKDEIWEIYRRISECKYPPFKIKIGKLNGFPTPRNARVIFLSTESPELNEIGNCIRSKTREWGDNKPFKGHITLARVRSGKFDTNRPAVNISYEWIVKQIKIKSSKLTPKGPIYRDELIIDLEA